MDPDPDLELAAEIALLGRVATGDRRSFAELYDRFSRVLFSVAYRVLNSQEAAEDVLQDVFIQIWEKAPLYDPQRGKPLTAWKAPAGPEGKKANQDFQKSEIEKSIAHLRTHIGLGLKA